MNPLLTLLLGQQAGATTAEPEEYQGQIDVVGKGSRPIEGPNYDDYVLNNVPAVNARAADIKETEAASQRRGMFGVKGTLRDVLGLLGDSFLVQSGNAPQYAPARRREQISDAQAGFTVDPVAASERVGYYDPQMGREMYNDYESSLVKKAQQESLEDSRQSLADNRLADNLSKGRLAIQSVLAQPGAIGPEGITPAAQKVIALIAKQHGASIEDLMDPGMTGEEATLYGTAGLSVNQQRNLPISQQRADAATSNAASAAVRSARPPAGRAPRAETDSEREIRIADTPVSKRTAGEQQWLQNRQNKSGSILEAFRQRQQPSTGSRFRPAGRQ